MGLTQLITAFGLAGAAGLNAYIPLLAVAVLGKLGFLRLSEPFDMLTSWPAIIALTVFLVIEFVVDKVPGADHVNDVIQTFVRPAAGAVLFAANSGVVSGHGPPPLSLVAGLVMALGVHGAKAAARPAVNLSTMGIGGPVVSVIEDVTSAVATFLAIFAPIVFVLFVVAIGYVVFRISRKIRARRVRGAAA
ncbi:MAG: DUF4126 domain-containing protein [Anaerolineae bacterium]|nr:DUF4126 domain-containing protein [Anaerolineae bacterium]